MSLWRTLPSGLNSGRAIDLLSRRLRQSAPSLPRGSDPARGAFRRPTGRALIRLQRGQECDRVVLSFFLSPVRGEITEHTEGASAGGMGGGAQCKQRGKRRSWLTEGAASGFLLTLQEDDVHLDKWMEARRTHVSPLKREMTSRERNGLQSGTVTFHK